MANGISIPVKLEVLQSSLSDLQKVLSNLQPNTSGFKQIQGIIASIRSDMDKLAIQSSKPFINQNQVNQAGKTVEGIENSFKKAELAMSRIKFSDLKLDDKQAAEFKELNAIIESIKRSVTSVKEAAKQSLLSGDAGELLGKIDTSAAAKNYDQLVKEIQQKTKQATDAYEKSKSELATAQRAAMLGSDADKLLNGGGSTKSLKALMGEDIYSEIFNKNGTFVKGNVGAARFADYLKNTFNLTDADVEEIRQSSGAQARKLITDADSEINKALSRIKETGTKADARSPELRNKLADKTQTYLEMQVLNEKVTEGNRQVEDTIRAQAPALTAAEAALQNWKNGLAASMQRSQDFGNANKQAISGIEQLRTALNQGSVALQKYQSQTQTFNSLKMAVANFMGFNQVLNLVKRGISDAANHIKELDTVMNGIAIVTDMTTADLWDSIDAYSQMAQRYGASIKGAYEVSQIYYQQGLETADVMTLTNETLKLSKISGMDYAVATDYMTTAIRGFKMEMQDASTVVDVYSALAANTAVSQEELAVAMSKTASSMEGVGATFEQASAMIGTMVAVTRESATNIGSAMKSIASRYGELTKNPLGFADEEGEAYSFNKVDTALQSVGISMKTVDGQFRNFTDVIIELGEKWDQLDSTQQRYIATQFAGNRQQSRFLALVSNVDLLKQNIDVAEGSEDTGTVQALKSLDSIETKLEQVKVAYQQFYTTIGVETVWKGALDGIKNYISALNNLPKVFGKIPINAIAMIADAVLLIRDIGSAILSGIAQIWEDIFPVDQMATAMATAMREVGKSGGQAVAEGLRDSQENIKQAGEELTNKASEGSKAAANDMNQPAGQQKQENKQTTEAISAQVIQETGVQQTAEQVAAANAAAEAAEQVANAQGRAAESAERAAEANQVSAQASQDIAANTALAQGSDTLYKTADELKAQIDSLNLTDTIKQQFATLDLNSESLTQQIVAIFQSAITAANQEGSALKEAFNAAGDDAIAGYVQGLLSGIGASDSAASSIGSSSVQALRTAIGAASPAKENIPTGHDYDDGFAKGIIENKESVINSSGELGAAAVEKLQSTVEEKKVSLNNELQSINEQIAKANKVQKTRGYREARRLESFYNQKQAEIKQGDVYRGHVSEARKDQFGLAHGSTFWGNKFEGTSNLIYSEWNSASPEVQDFIRSYILNYVDQKKLEQLKAQTPTNITQQGLNIITGTERRQILWNDISHYGVTNVAYQQRTLENARRDVIEGRPGGDLGTIATFYEDFRPTQQQYELLAQGDTSQLEARKQAIIQELNELEKTSSPVEKNSNSLTQEEQELNQIRGRLQAYQDIKEARVSYNEAKATGDKQLIADADAKRVEANLAAVNLGLTTAIGPAELNKQINTLQAELDLRLNKTPKEVVEESAAENPPEVPVTPKAEEAKDRSGGQLPLLNGEYIRPEVKIPDIENVQSTIREEMHPHLDALPDITNRPHWEPTIPSVQPSAATESTATDSAADDRIAKLKEEIALLEVLKQARAEGNSEAAKEATNRIKEAGIVSEKAVGITNATLEKRLSDRQQELAAITAEEKIELPVIVDESAKEQAVEVKEAVTKTLTSDPPEIKPEVVTPAVETQEIIEPQVEQPQEPTEEAPKAGQNFDPEQLESLQLEQLHADFAESRAAAIEDKTAPIKEEIKDTEELIQTRERLEHTEVSPKAAEASMKNIDGIDEEIQAQKRLQEAREAANAQSGTGLKEWGKDHSYGISSTARALSMLSGVFDTTSQAGLAAASAFQFASAGLKIFDGIAKGITSGNGFLAVVSGIITLVNAISTLYEDDNEKLERLTKEAEELSNESKIANADYNSLKKTSDKLDELKEKRYESAEASEAYQEAVDDLTSKFPELILSFDDAGNAILNEAAMTDTLTAAREKSAQAAYDAAKAEVERAKKAKENNIKTAKSKLKRSLDTNFTNAQGYLNVDSKIGVFQDALFENDAIKTIINNAGYIPEHTNMSDLVMQYGSELQVARMFADQAMTNSELAQYFTPEIVGDIGYNGWTLDTIDIGKFLSVLDDLSEQPFIAEDADLDNLIASFQVLIHSLSSSFDVTYDDQLKAVNDINAAVQELYDAANTDDTDRLLRAQKNLSALLSGEYRRPEYGLTAQIIALEEALGDGYEEINNYNAQLTLELTASRQLVNSYLSRQTSRAKQLINSSSAIIGVLSDYIYDQSQSFLKDNPDKSLDDYLTVDGATSIDNLLQSAESFYSSIGEEGQEEFNKIFSNISKYNAQDIFNKYGQDLSALGSEENTFWNAIYDYVTEANAAVQTRLKENYAEKTNQISKKIQGLEDHQFTVQDEAVINNLQEQYEKLTRYGVGESTHAAVFDEQATAIVDALVRLNAEARNAVEEIIKRNGYTAEGFAQSSKDIANLDIEGLDPKKFTGALDNMAEEYVSNVALGVQALQDGLIESWKTVEDNFSKGMSGMDIADAQKWLEENNKYLTQAGFKDLDVTDLDFQNGQFYATVEQLTAIRKQYLDQYNTDLEKQTEKLSAITTGLTKETDVTQAAEYATRVGLFDKYFIKGADGIAEWQAQYRDNNEAAIEDIISTAQKNITEVEKSATELSRRFLETVQNNIRESIDISAFLDATTSRTRDDEATKLVKQFQSLENYQNILDKAGTIAYKDQINQLGTQDKNLQDITSEVAELVSNATDETILNVLESGGNDAVELLKLIKPESSSEELEAAYNAQISKLRTATDDLGKGVGETISGFAVDIARTAGFGLDELDDGTAVITSVGNMVEAYSALYAAMAVASAHTTADLNSAYVQLLTAGAQKNTDALDTLNNAYEMSYDAFGSLMDSYGMNMRDVLTNTKDFGQIIDDGFGHLRIEDFNKFAEGMGWDIDSPQFAEAYSNWVQARADWENKPAEIIQSAADQLKSLTEAKGGQAVDISYLAKALNMTDDQFNELFEEYGVELTNGLLQLGDYVDIPGLITAIDNQAAEAGALLPEQLAELQDAVEGILSQITSIISNGISGSMSNAEAQQLQTWINHQAGFEDLQLDFTRTEEGLQLSTASAKALYDAVNQIDRIQGQIVFKALSESLIKTNDNFKTTSALMAHINKIRNDTYSADNKVSNARKEQYEAELAIAEEILAVRATTEDDSFKFMDQSIPAAQNNPLNYWEGWGKAFDAIKASKKTGYMEYQDFYNLVTELGNLSDLMGGEGIRIGKDLEVKSSNVADLIEQAGKHLEYTTEDGKLKIKLPKIGVDFAESAKDMESGIDKGIDAMADSQINMLDGLIALLETIVAMEKLSDITDEGGDKTKFDLGDIFPEITFDEHGVATNLNQMKTYGEGYKNFVKEIKSQAKEGTDLRKALDSIQINNQSLYSILDLSAPELAAKGQEFGEAYTAIMEGFRQAALSGNYDVDNIMTSVQQVLTESGITDLTIDTGKSTMVIKGGIITTIDWEDEEVADLVKDLKDKLGKTEQQAKKLITTAQEKYLSGEKIEELTLEEVLRINHKYKIKDNVEYLEVTDENGNTHTYSAEDDKNWLGAQAAQRMKDMGLGENFTIDGEVATGTITIGSHTNVQVKGTVDSITLSEDTEYGTVTASSKSEWLEEYVKAYRKDTGETPETITDEQILWHKLEIRNEINTQVTGEDGKQLDASNPKIRKALQEAKQNLSSLLTKESVTGDGNWIIEQGGIKIVLDGRKIEADVEGTPDLTQAEAEISSLLGIDEALKLNISEGITAAFTNLSSTLENLDAQPATNVANAILAISNNATTALENVSALVDKLKEMDLSEGGSTPESTPTTEKQTAKEYAEAKGGREKASADAKIDVGYGKSVEIKEGNVDLNNRKKISAETMRAAGYSNFQDDYATLFSQTFTSAGTAKVQLVINATPITPDGEVFSEDFLQDYIEGLMGDGTVSLDEVIALDAQDLGLIINATEVQSSMEEAVAIMEESAEKIHEAQAEMYDDVEMPEIDTDSIEQAGDSFEEAASEISDSSQQVSTDVQSMSDTVGSAMDSMNDKVANASGSTKTHLDEMMRAGVEAVNQITTAINSLAQHVSIVFEANIKSNIPGLDGKSVIGGVVEDSTATITYVATGGDQVKEEKEELQSALEIPVSANTDAADTALQTLVTAITTAQTTPVNLQSSPEQIQAQINSRSYTAPVRLIPSGGFNVATGNVGLARAAGTLMGELGPELVVSHGHYFVAGQNGPEFVDLADDAIVFNHLQTQQLLKNGMSTSRGQAVTNERNAVAFASGNVNGGPAMASAGAALAALKELRAMWESLKNASVSDLAGAAGGGGGGGGGDKTPEEWVALVERWYNLMQEIAKLEKEITHEEALRSKIQGDFSKNGKDYFKSQQRSLEALHEQILAQEQLNLSREDYFDSRRRALEDTPLGSIYEFDDEGQMKFKTNLDSNKFNGKTNAFDFLQDLYGYDEKQQARYTNKEKYDIMQRAGFGEYMLYDSNGTAINKDDFENEDEYYKTVTQQVKDRIDDYAQATQSLWDEIQEGQTDLLELEAKRNELLAEMRDNQKEVEDEVLKAIEDIKQREIDALQDERDKLEDSVGKYIDGLTNALNNERQMYETQEAQNELDMQKRRLAILQRSGASAEDIYSLQNEIRSAEKDMYFDAQQAQIDAIQEASDLEIERLDSQIKIMTESLEYQKEFGLLWYDVYDVMDGSAAQIANFIMHGNSEFWNLSPLATTEKANELIFQTEQWKGYQAKIESMEANLTQAAIASRREMRDSDYKTFDTAMKREFGDEYDPTGQYQQMFYDLYENGEYAGDLTKISAAVRKKYSDTVNAQKNISTPAKTTAASAPAANSGGGGSSGGENTTPTKKIKEQGWASSNGKHWWQIFYTDGSGERTKEGNCDSKGAIKRVGSKTYYTCSVCGALRGEVVKNNDVDAVTGASVSVSEQKAKIATTAKNIVTQTATTVTNWLKSITGKKAEGGFVKQPMLSTLAENGEEAVLNAEQTKILRNNILSNKPNSLISLLKSYNEGYGDLASGREYDINTSTDESVTIEHVEVNMNVQQLANDYDARRAGDQAMQEILRIASKTSAANSIRR